MTDMLRMDYINALPQPFQAFLGEGMGTWPINDIEVKTGLMRLDVVGLLQVIHISDVLKIIDANNRTHDPDTFWSDFR